MTTHHNVFRKDIVVVTPVYKPLPSSTESAAIQQGRKMLNTYDRILVAPKGLDVSAYLSLDKDLEVLYFDRKHFDGIKAYNQMLMSPFFYRAFEKYKYMLIYQTDAWVFRDELLDWANKGYDYIGAPWISLPPLQKKPIIDLSKLMLGKVGNGGFCLRNIKTHYWSALVFRPLSWIFSKNEDFFWCYIVRKLNPFYKVPDAKEALYFAFELAPSKSFESTNHQLPFGCHAWEKYEPEFWQSYINEKSTTE